MRFSPSDYEYLKGARFSTGHAVTVARPERGVPMRLDYLEALARGKKVIHLGFCDHLEVIDRKRAENTWLHDRLTRAAARCLGIDNHRAAVEHVRDRLGVRDVYCHDVVAEGCPNTVAADRWDYLILGELLEHTDDPVCFLSNLRDKYGPHVQRIVVTVPNAFDLVSLKHLLRYQEFINTDHRYWFTPFTLAKVGTRARLRVVDFVYCQSYMPDGWLARRMIRRFPQLRESVAMTFELE